MRRSVVAVTEVLFAALAVVGLGDAQARANSPIRHIVIIDEENHSFDDILGKFCAEQAAGQIIRAGLNQPCDGATTGTISNGSIVPLGIEPDYGLHIDHSVSGQHKVIDGGQMDGWDKLSGCTRNSHPPYGCLKQFDPLNGTCGSTGTSNCLPNVDSYAEHYAISDRTFEFRQTPSWAGHMILGSASIQHFRGDNPRLRASDPGGSGGWGCNSGKSTQWFVSGNSGSIIYVPSCIPDQSGSLGPTWPGYTGTHAVYEPTIFDLLDQASLSWKIYTGKGIPIHGEWSICPTFWECLGSSQVNNLVSNTAFPADAAGTLPAVSFVIPGSNQSAHPPSAASSGDNWVGSVVSGVMNGPNWDSTAIFITYDDCGCFHDHVNPLQYNPEWGVRVPMMIVSPYAKAGYTDSTPATFVSLLAFIEHNLGLPSLNPCATVNSWDSQCTDDADAYDFSNAFDFNQKPLSPLAASRTAKPLAEQIWLKAHPDAGDEVT